MPQPLYVFDMDDTLIDGDCSMLWNQYLVNKGIVTSPDFLETDKRLMDLYSIGKMDMEEYLEFFMQPLINIPQQEVNRMVDEFVSDYVKPRVFNEALSLINDLKAQSHTMLIISATVSFIVRKVAVSLGVSEAIGIDMVIQNDRYTSKIEGVPSYREGKIKRLKDWIGQEENKYTSVHFYTDSINDLPLCEYSDYTYLINPCTQLKKEANSRPWQIYHWGK
ncbi:HAD family hydrolase [Vibrio salinus]|uniref:HAD family hydrolase n=1 Tax=Vibrio salinus TaxID=2899784 RepID=UPI001E416651|nr:HAD family hydrolase [Vibrio salinus]MCE0496178.1 HAD-IB family hydrolase [Vibrio salinus]